MSDMTTAAAGRPGSELVGRTVVLIGGSAGIGLETARRARAEGAEVVLTGRDPDRLTRAAADVGAQRAAAFDVTDDDALAGFFGELPAKIDHVMVTAGGPRYAPLLEMDSAQVREVLSGHVATYLAVARHAANKLNDRVSLVFMGGTGGRRISKSAGIVSAATSALPPFTAALALELAPVRVNLIAAGFVDTPLSQRTPIDGLFLAGDWTRTGLPSTMEAAAESAVLAVDAVREFLGARVGVAEGDNQVG
ncbi:SDR family oxidoreductase [Nocardia sp. NBC_01377]|uniref:SDR family oxidoreductase n=1 Tax=Nocardia sp. NBC_01377 TaxID=2903595 RepID=UPI00324F159A